jgi:hypothetical protein
VIPVPGMKETAAVAWMRSGGNPAVVSSFAKAIE